MNIDTKLKLMLENPGFGKAYNEAVNTLEALGVLGVLRELAKVKQVNETHPNFIAAQASQASQSLGYNNALDDLIYFQERYVVVQPTVNPAAVPMDFGGINIALLNGTITEEEANEYRSGK